MVLKYQKLIVIYCTRVDMNSDIQIHPKAPVEHHRLDLSDLQCLNSSMSLEHWDYLQDHLAKPG